VMHYCSLRIRIRSLAESLIIRVNLVLSSYLLSSGGGTYDGGAGNRRPVCTGQDPIPAVMDLMMRIAAASLTVVVLNAVLRRQTPELALLLTVCAGVWILTLTAQGLGAAMELMKELAGLAGLSEELLEPLVKTVALSILTRLTAEICRGAGESGVAAFVEMAGTVLALVVALPLVRAVTVLMAEMLT